MYYPTACTEGLARLMGGGAKLEVIMLLRAVPAARKTQRKSMRTLL